jgi:2-aminoethylphosphonate-pyruvate transaminase
VPTDGVLLVLSNGAYGLRMARIARRLGIELEEIRQSETESVDLDRVRDRLARRASITHVAMVHCETTTGMLNPAREVGQLAAEFDKCFILDAMSSFGGMPMTVDELGVHYLISSANKCIQGVPGFSFVVARRETLAASGGRARSMSLDLHDQWQEMERGGGKWRYTSPTHAVMAFAQALVELREEGGVERRYHRYCANHRALVQGMNDLGFRTLLPANLQSPIITSFRDPADPRFSFAQFYEGLKARRFVIYPGKVTDAATFRIGTIGHVFPEDIRELLAAIAAVQRDMAFKVS